MKTVDRIVAEVFQGRSLDVRIDSPAVLFVGPNGSGKSTRLRALQVGLVGAAQSPADRSRPYLGPEAIGAVTIHSGADVLTRPIGLSPAAKPAKEATDRARTLFGAGVVAFDLADFAAASQADRSETLKGILAAAGPSRTSLADLAARLRTLLDLPARPAEIPPSHALAELATARPMKASDGLPPTALSWLDSATAWADAALTAANAEAKRTDRIPEPVQAPDGDPADMEAERDRLRGELADLAAAAKARASLAARLATAQEALDRARRAEPPQAGPTAAEIEAAAAAQSDAEMRVQEARNWLEAAQDGSRAAERAHTAAVAALRVALGHRSQVCRHCGAADPLGEAPDLDALRATAARASADLDAEQGSLDAAEEETREAQAAYRDAATEVRRLDTAARAAQASAPDLAGPTAQVAELRRQLDEAPEPVDAAPLHNRIAVLDDAIRRAARAAQVNEARESAIVARDTAVARRAGIVALRGALATVRGELAAEVLGPLRVAADALLVAAGETMRTWFADDGSSFGATLDPSPDAERVPYWCLSDSERSLVGASIAVGIATLSRAPYRAVILDGMERMDAERLPRVLSALASGAARGEYQFIGAAVSAPDVDGLQVVDLVQQS